MERGHPNLPSNKQGNKLISTYNSIIAEPLKEGIIESAPETPKRRVFYIPQKPVVKAETTKVHIVYDTSPRVYPEAPNLNNILYAGPPLQNKLWNVLIQQRAHPNVVTRDISMAFLQARVREDDRIAQ